MSMHAKGRDAGCQAGFSLIEILVTILILAIGLLGLAGLQTRMLTTELESFQRSQALVLVQDMVNRLNANRESARRGDYSGTAVYGTGNSLGDSGCSQTDVADLDLCQWSQSLKGVGIDDAGNAVGAMIGARGCIERLSGTDKSEVVLRVTVAWQGMSSSVAPSLTCAQGEYGDDDSMRRTVSMLVTLAYLGM